MLSCFLSELSQIIFNGLHLTSLSVYITTIIITVVIIKKIVSCHMQTASAFKLISISIAISSIICVLAFHLYSYICIYFFHNHFSSPFFTSTVTIFVEENHGEECSEIHSLKIFGEAVMGTNVSNIKGYLSIIHLLYLLHKLCWSASDSSRTNLS